MNKAKLKSYAPEARRDFIKAVTERAHFFGIAADQIEPAEVQGDVAIIAGRALPKKVIAQRDQLIELVRREGFELTMRKVAYTWFNRFMALRYMELHNYLEHGFRVLSNPSGSQTPEILEQATHVELSGLDRDKVVELKLDGTKDAELYRMLIVAECNTLHRSMPFLFEAIDGPSELLLPDNLLHSDSIIRKLVTSIDEQDWQQVEIIGWLYQFYISEKKDEVIGKVVKSEDIPAATQLFTPNWIVKYMVQNSLGRKWLMTYPDSALVGKMEYFIGPGEQTADVGAALVAITPESLDPEELTLLDPACGSGHILVEAYDLLKEIYLERGYRSRDIPRLILEKNLYGLDIDDRAAQMAGFALLMKARADDRRILSHGLRLNVLSLRETQGLDLAGLWRALNFSGDWHVGESEGLFADEQPDLGHAQNDKFFNLLQTLVERFSQAKTFGSLIDIPAARVPDLLTLEERLVSLQQSGDTMQISAAQRLLPIVRQACLLTQRYDAVVANPPYMGSKGMNASLKEFAKAKFPDSKSDLFAIFIERNLDLVRDDGVVAMITMQSWMFLSSYEKLRGKLLDEFSILSMAHLGARGFDSIGGEVVQTTAFVLGNKHMPGYKGAFIRLVDGKSEAEKAEMFKRAIQ